MKERQYVTEEIERQKITEQLPRRRPECILCGEPAHGKTWCWFAKYVRRILASDGVVHTTKFPSEGGMEHLHCHNCGQSVSSLVPKGTTIRGWIECPECMEKKIEA